MLVLYGATLIIFTIGALKIMCKALASSKDNNTELNLLFPMQLPGAIKKKQKTS